MKKFKLLGAILLSYSLLVYSQDEPLVIAAHNFIPPFVLQGTHNQLFGFDIGMMESLCQIMKRQCRYTPIPFNKLFDTLISGDAQIAIGAITITPERAQIVNFSLPYLVSYAQFLGPKQLANQNITLNFLNNKRIGVEQGTLFLAIVDALEIDNPTVISYDSTESIIDALNNGNIDLALMDAPAAQYWQAQASNTLIALGKPFNYGFGLGIAVTKEDPVLLEQINQALIQYQNNGLFAKNYELYLQPF